MDTTTFNLADLRLLLSDDEILQRSTEQYNELITTHAEVFKKAGLLSAIITEIGTPSPNGVNEETKVYYNKNMSWFDKVKYFLKKNPDGLTRAKLVDLVAEKDKATDEAAIEKISSNIGYVVSHNSKNEGGKLTRLNLGQGKPKYILAENQSMPPSPAPAPTVNRNDGYDPDWQWYGKMIFFLKDAPNGLTSAQLTKMIANREGRTSKEEIRKMIGSISARLSSGTNVDGLFSKHPIPGDQRGTSVYKLIKK
jgi:hypothetical protein